ncbi:MAG: GxxExxY protein [Terriglobia bacterium]|jgi:GxxExxY protein|nr:GxxExxY protein [Terriglobia bacterium]
MINAEVAERREGKGLNELSNLVIRCAMKVHTELGPGLLESACEGCLARELRKSGLKVGTQVALPVIYEEIQIDLGYRRAHIVNRL